MLGTVKIPHKGETLEILGRGSAGVGGVCRREWLRDGDNLIHAHLRLHFLCCPFALTHGAVSGRSACSADACWGQGTDKVVLYTTPPPPAPHLQVYPRQE